MKLSLKKLAKLRSGQTVWRTLGWYRSDTGFTMGIEEVLLSGKRYTVSEVYNSLYLGKRDKTDWMKDKGWFLASLEGSGCFDSRRQAERFRQEFVQGLHPDVEAETLRRLDYWKDRFGNIHYDSSFNRMMDDYHYRDYGGSPFESNPLNEFDDNAD